MDLWSWIWFYFWMFAYVAYILVLVYIVIDVFRDHELNGWMKALWLVLLVFLPWITGLVYLIARGKGMAERSGRKQVEYEEYSQEEYRRMSFANPADEIAKAQALRDQGVITDGEFEAIKAKALGSKF
ncbi:MULTISPECIES: SHOCT domain-containing protein [unclassified Agromyces]|uniref:SHOCT domain-containing protein n=1 Tax=unclassified Agromyces TaxID=2639701 RepID=UPI003014B93A